MTSFMGSLSTAGLFGVFGVGAVFIWVAGVYLSKTTDALDDRLGLGEALGGMILLAIAGSLPELAITVSAALQNNIDMAAGNLIGGIAMQTLVLVICDAVVRGKRPLSYLVGSLVPVLEGLLVLQVIAVAFMGAVLPDTATVGNAVSPASIGIVVVWFAGIMVLNRSRKNPRWSTVAEGSSPGRAHRREEHATAPKPYATSSTAVVAGIFALGSLVTLAAGVVLQTSGNLIATRLGVNQVVFGATFLALASALPEISTGVAAVRLGDNQLVMGDIFGGNAFQLCLFLLADLLAGQPVLPHAGPSNGWLAALGSFMTAVYVVAVIVRPEKRVLRLGYDSIFAVVLYALGLWGLVLIAASG